MIYATDHSTGLLFDRWSHLGPRQLKILGLSWAGVFRNNLLPKLPVGRIALHFERGAGRPTKELYTVVGALVLQPIFDLSDEELQRALMFNLEFQYALDIPNASEENTYISERTLRYYRALIEKEGLAPVIFEMFTDELITAFKVDASNQRMDSTHAQSNMRKLGRIRLIAATIRKFLKKLKRFHKKEFATSISPELIDRYLAKGSDGCFSRVKPSESSKTLLQVSRDLLFLVETFSAHDDIRKMETYHALKRALREQCTVTGESEEKKVAVKPPKEVSPDSLQNPSDPDASYNGHKGQGYEVQLMETYQTGERDPKVPNLITYFDVNPAHVHDSAALIPALDATEKRDCCPKHLVCDTHYGSDENLLAAAEKGVTVVAPVAGPAPAESITLAHFSPDPETGYVTRCPEGHAPLTMRQTETQRLIAAFPKKACQTCPRQKDCPVKLEKKAAYLRYDLPSLRCSVRRAREHTPEFREEYRWRAGIEGTNSHLKSDFGMGRLRVRGLEAVRLVVAFKVLGLNIMRCARALAACFWIGFRLFSAKITSREHVYSRIQTLFEIITPFSLNTQLVA
jgi:hypothetical protein